MAGRQGERLSGGNAAGVAGASVRAKAAEWFTRPARSCFVARIVSVGLIGVLPTAAGTEINAPFG